MAAGAGRPALDWEVAVEVAWEKRAGSGEQSATAMQPAHRSITKTSALAGPRAPWRCARRCCYRDALLFSTYSAGKASGSVMMDAAHLVLHLLRGHAVEIVRRDDRSAQRILGHQHALLLSPMLRSSRGLSVNRWPRQRGRHRSTSFLIAPHACGRNRRV